MSFSVTDTYFGPALFVAWIGGGSLVIGGILKSVAFREMVKDEKITVSPLTDL